MSSLLKLALLVLAIFTPGLAVGYMYYNANLSSNDWGYEGGLNWNDGGVHAAPGELRGAPGPLMGAGLPVLVVLAGGYWVVRRLRRRQTEQSH